MTAVPPEIDFDHHSASYAEDPWSIYADLRTKCPVAHSAHHGGFWLLSGYEQVFAAARDDATFSSAHVLDDPLKRGISIPDREFISVPIEMDPPEFRKYRNLLNPYFAPKATQRWRDVIAKWTTGCRDAVVETGRFDIVFDLGNPVPALFTSEFLGLPLEHWHKYAEPMHTQIYSVPGTPEYDKALEGSRWIVESLYELTKVKRSNPADDLLSDLTQVRLDGEPLSDDIIVNMAFLVIAGGFDTTTAMLANMLRYLDQDRVARQVLIDDPDKIKFAIEEFLRYFAPTQALGRTVTTDTTFFGQELKKGDRVLISWAAANHDPAVFDQPDQIVLDRSPNRHTTFGVGVHRCLGSNFARAELALMLGEVLKRIPDYRIVEAESVKYPTIGIVNGWVSMPATFTPSQRVTTDVLPSVPIA